jgi:hypothetical protein
MIPSATIGRGCTRPLGSESMPGLKDVFLMNVKSRIRGRQGFVIDCGTGVADATAISGSVHIRLINVSFIYVYRKRARS